MNQKRSKNINIIKLIFLDCNSYYLLKYGDYQFDFVKKTAVLYKYAYLAAAYNRREKKENWDDREESGFRAYS